MNPPEEILHAANLSISVRRFNTVVVGSGAAGLGAAETIWRGGQRSVALVTESLAAGTSRNTGSDKQTYYKLSLAGDGGDSVRSAAATLFGGGAMDGDIALAEAALSARCFFRLVELGVPFPHNAYGEYIGYKTDHDPFTRGTSAGPLTSKYMTECLLRAVRETGLPVFDKQQVIEILTAPDGENGKRALGVLCLNLADAGSPDSRYSIFLSENVVYATGGEAGMYGRSVYPASQTGSTGAALRAGCIGKNLTESQYGITSIQFRWNLSGTYQQVLPRYISTNKDGADVREFLNPYFPSPSKLLTAIFLKGYQWPFDPRKIANHGSSLIDLLVYHETMTNNRRVFLDYRSNPSVSESSAGIFDKTVLEPEVADYLEKSGALFGTPIERLKTMNPAAIDLYASHHIDLRNEPLEIAVSAQHNNGGLAANAWWESNVRHLFPVGEVNGTHGVYRPGGSALNAGQVGGVRAGAYIVHKYRGEPPPVEQARRHCLRQVEEAIQFGENALATNAPKSDLAALRREIGDRMSRAGAHIRSAAGTALALAEAEDCVARIENRLSIESPFELRRLHQLRDIAVCHVVYLAAIKNYIDAGGESRGSYLVHRPGGAVPAEGLPESLAYTLDDGRLDRRIQEVRYVGGKCEFAWRDVRPMPDTDNWFEVEWGRFRSGEIFDSPHSGKKTEDLGI